MPINVIRLAVIVVVINSVLMLFFVGGYYPTANVYVSVAVLTFCLCVFGIPFFAALAQPKTIGSFFLLTLVAMIIFAPSAIVITKYYAALHLPQLIAPIVGGMIAFSLTFGHRKE